MKANKIILAFAAAALLAACRTQLTPEEEASYIAEHTSKTTSSTPSTTSSEPASVTSSDDPSSDPSSDPTSDPSSDPVSDPSSDPTSDPSSDPTSDPSSDDDKLYVYFRESTWWNSPTGVPYVSLDGAGISGDVGDYEVDFDLVLPMEYVSTVQESATEYFNYYRIEAEKTVGQFIQILRCGPVYVDDLPTDDMAYWGAATEPMDLTEWHRDGMIDIHDSAKPAAWEEGAPEGSSRLVSAVWSTYDPESDVPYVPSSSDSSEPSGDIRDPHGPEGSELVEWYIVGEGTLFSGWGSGTKLQMYSNPNSATDKGCLQDVYFGEGDVFKVTDLDKTWFGYEGVDKYESPENLGLTNFEGADDGYGGSNFKCIVEGYYDVYVNGSGVFWITESSGPLA